MLLPSIRSLKTGSLLIAALAASALPAFAGDVTTTTTSSKDKNPVIEKPTTEPRFYIDLLAGGEFDTGYTNFLTNGFNNGLNTVNARTTLPESFQARDFNETHDAGVINGRLELGYKVLPYLSVFVGGTYSHAGGNDRANVGFVTDSNGQFGAAGTNYNLLAGVGQYQSYSGIAGFKLNTPRNLLDLLHIPKAIKPYLTVSSGGKFIDDQDIRFFNNGGGGVGTGEIVDSGRFLLYHASWVFTTEAELGYELALTRNISINFEGGYGYDTKPERGSLPAIYTGINRGADRLYSNEYLGMKFSF